MCSTLKTGLEQAKKQPTAKKNAAPVKKTKTKKELAAEAKAHAELFGGFVEDELDHYDDQYDDFM